MDRSAIQRLFLVISARPAGPHPAFRALERPRLKSTNEHTDPLTELRVVLSLSKDKYTEPERQFFSVISVISVASVVDCKCPRTAGFERFAVHS